MIKHTLAQLAYSLSWWLLTPLVLLRLWLKGRKQPAYRERIKERFGLWPAIPCNCFWVHAVSVGETIAAKELVTQWQQNHPDVPVLITTMTPTGSQTVRQLFGHSVHHAYLPWDIRFIQQRLVKQLQPKILVIMETELWPNLVRACTAQNVPILLANARLSEKSKTGYQKFSALTLPMLNRLTGIAAQHNADAARFIELGVSEKNIQITGSIKFDISVDEKTVTASSNLKNEIGKRHIWIAASTHEGEDEIILAAHQQLRLNLPDALLILVPRHPERADQLMGLIQKTGLSVARRSLGEIPTEHQSVFLVDTLGELMVFFDLADAAFIGNSFNEGGGHNPIEPAALATPVLIGPSAFNFQSIVDAMRSEQAIVTVKSAQELKNRLVGLLQSKDLRDTYGQRAYLFFQQQQGALTRLITWLENIIDLDASDPSTARRLKHQPENKDHSEL